MTFNYKWHRGRLSIPVVDSLPDGVWMSVKEAAKVKKVSEMTIRMWYLKKNIPAIYLKSKGKTILVKLF